MSETITFRVQNSLGQDVVLYDSYCSDEAGDSTYYGKLTCLGSLANGTLQTYTPLHSPVSVFIAFDDQQRPVGRYVQTKLKTSFEILPADLTAVQDSSRFLDYVVAHPTAPDVTQFQSLTKNGDSSGVDKFFAQETGYTNCTFPTYMLALTDRAQQPPPKPDQPAPAQPPPEQASPNQRYYSLQALCTYLGFTWPSDLGDIQLRDLKCSTQNDVLFLAGTVEVDKLPFANDQIGRNVALLLQIHEVEVQVYFDYQIGLNVLGTSLQFVSNDIRFPDGGHHTITFEAPTILLNLNPLLKFVVFEAKASIPFQLFGKKFDANLVLSVDNVEAEVSVVISGDNSSLPAPPPIKGVQFDQFSVGIGLIFEPPSVALGVQGKLHIGDGGNAVALGNFDTFTVVCAMEEEVPNPLYLAFYVPELDLNELVEIFTDARAFADFPVKLQDVSFQWVEDPAEPVTLPDGSLTSLAYACSCYVHLLDFEFYGSISLDMNGIEANITSSPVTFGKLLSITGDGKGVTLKVDSNGNPVNNSQLPTTQAARKALDAAPTKQFVVPGGPQLVISSSSQPFFLLTAAVSLFEVVDERISAKLDMTGVYFELDYGAVLQGTMKCTLKDFHNFAASFQYGLNTTVSLPIQNNFPLGSLRVQATAGVSLSIQTTLDNITFSVGAAFAFQGITFNLGPYQESVDISSIHDLVNRLVQNVQSEASQLFASFYTDATKWASYVREGVVQSVSSVAAGLKNAYGKSLADASRILNAAGFGESAAARDLKSVFNPAAEDLASALKSGFDDTSNGVAIVLKNVGYGAQDVAGALNKAFGLAPDAINSVMQVAGFTVDQIKDAFQSLGGDFASFAKSTWDHVEQTMNPKHW